VAVFIISVLVLNQYEFKTLNAVLSPASNADSTVPNVGTSPSASPEKNKVPSSGVERY
jgi:hypothetical protein